jgi:hypothetical protein
MEDNQTLNQPTSFKTPQPDDLQSEESKASVRERLLQEQGDQPHPTEQGVNEDDVLQKNDDTTDSEHNAEHITEDIGLANLQIGIANRLAD